MQSIPMATQAAGANNNTGGIGALNSPWGGSGMDLNNAQRLLNPAGIGGGGGLNKSSIESFFDPAGIDSGPYGLNLFGQRGANNASSPTSFPNLGAQSLIPVMPGGAFQNIHNGTGAYNNMAATGAGGQMFNPSIGAPQSSGGSKPQQTAPNAHLMNGQGGNSLRIKP